MCLRLGRHLLRDISSLSISADATTARTLRSGTNTETAQTYKADRRDLGDNILRRAELHKNDKETIAKYNVPKQIDLKETAVWVKSQNTKVAKRARDRANNQHEDFT